VAAVWESTVPLPRLCRFPGSSVAFTALGSPSGVVRLHKATRLVQRSAASSVTGTPSSRITPVRNVAGGLRRRWKDRASDGHGGEARLGPAATAETGLRERSGTTPSFRHQAADLSGPAGRDRPTVGFLPNGPLFLGRTFHIHRYCNYTTWLLVYEHAENHSRRLARSAGNRTECGRAGLRAIADDPWVCPGRVSFLESRRAGGLPFATEREPNANVDTQPDKSSGNHGDPITDGDGHPNADTVANGDRLRAARELHHQRRVRGPRLVDGLFGGALSHILSTIRRRLLHVLSGTGKYNS
jgi:hypothetical protein